MDRDQLLDALLLELSALCRRVCTEADRALDMHSPDCIGGKLGLEMNYNDEEEEQRMRLFIHGNPYPQPRPRSRAVKDKASGKHRAQTYGFKKDHPITVWRHRVRQALELEGLIPYPDGVALAVWLTFYIERPKSHYRTGKNAHLLKESAPYTPTHQRSGDADNFAKAVLDEMNGLVFADDAQVVRLTVEKAYATEPERAGVLIEVRRERGEEAA